VRDAVLSDLVAFRGAAEQEDDVTIVVCRVA
jgi:serine phosphatase RsbU (regulator of sigma subunit)